jgi:hypothetical protein
MNASISRLGAPALIFLLSSPAGAQGFTFSIDWKGPMIGQAASLSPQPITEADILTFGPGAPGFGPLPPPALELTGFNLGLSLYTICSGHQPGQPCGIEVDALSQGTDRMLSANISRSEELWFSTDEWAQGMPQAHLGPTVFTEGGLAGDISADIFATIGLPNGPFPPSGGIGRHVGVFDGNGLPTNSIGSAQYPGIGLVEPNVPNSTIDTDGDNLDALNLNAQHGFPPGGYYFSVDSGVSDPLSTVPNSGTASNEGVSGGDVLLVSIPAAPPTVFASANLLGLDLVSGADSDDLDALVLVENGDGLFNPSKLPYDWIGGGTDMLLFSVRRGSAVIGQLDSIFGEPIEPGDVLTTPLGPAHGGVSPFPGIFFAAESLGLRTSRTHGALFGDDVNAMDFEGGSCFDCNNNGVEDAVDIATGSSSDANDNGIPDECEAIEEYGYCRPSFAPCGNHDVEAGCENSTGSGAHLYFTGTHEVGADDLVLNGTGLPPRVFGLFFMGSGRTSVLFGDGLRVVSDDPPGLFRFPVQATTLDGAMTEGPGIVALSCAHLPPPGCITAGSTWNFQGWYRDSQGPCGLQFNTTNGLEVVFGP